MSYKDIRPSIFNDEEFNDVDGLLDSIWMKMKEMADSYNDSVKIGNINHIEHLHRDLFSPDDALLVMIRDWNRRTGVSPTWDDTTKTVKKSVEKEGFNKIPVDMVYFTTVPKTVPELLTYFVKYQELAQNFFKYNLFEKYEYRNGYLVNTVVDAEEKEALKNAEKKRALEETERRRLLEELEMRTRALEEAEKHRPKKPLTAKSTASSTKPLIKEAPAVNVPAVNVPTVNELPAVKEAPGNSVEQCTTTQQEQDEFDNVPELKDVDISKLDEDVREKMQARLAGEHCSTYDVEEALNRLMHPLSDYPQEYKKAREEEDLFVKYFIKCLINDTIMWHEKNKHGRMKALLDSLGFNIDRFRDNLFLNMYRFYINKSQSGFVATIWELMKTNYLYYREPKTRNGEERPPYSDATLSKPLKNPLLHEFLITMIGRSARPFNLYERFYAVDGTGFDCSNKSDYRSAKYNRKIYRSEFRDANVMCGIYSTCITCATVDGQYETDELGALPELARQLKLNFYVKYLLADKGYVDKQMLQRILKEFDVIMFVPLKDNSLINPEDTTDAWEMNIRMNLTQAWRKIYGDRSTIECVFSAIKQKFGEKLKEEDDIALDSECYIKFALYNIHKLITYMYVIKDFKIGFVSPDTVAKLQNKEEYEPNSADKQQDSTIRDMCKWKRKYTKKKPDAWCDEKEEE